MGKQPIDFTYHSHTYRCGHAVGEDYEYAEKAIEAGLKILGYTDHVILPDLTQRNMRGKPEELEGYIQSVNSLKEKYKDKLEIHLGFEAEYFGERYLDYYRSLLRDKVEYLILGQHCFLWGDKFVFYGGSYDDTEALERYGDDLIAGMESGLFTYVCHPDVFMAWYPLWNDRCDKLAHRICQKAVELDMPLELNMGCSYRPSFRQRRDYLYPHPRFWKVVGQYPVKTIIGMDTHSPQWLVDGDVAWFLRFAERNKLNLIDRIEFKNPFK